MLPKPAVFSHTYVILLLLSLFVRLFSHHRLPFSLPHTPLPWFPWHDRPLITPRIPSVNLANGAQQSDEKLATRRNENGRKLPDENRFHATPPRRPRSLSPCRLSSYARSPSVTCASSRHRQIRYTGISRLKARVLANPLRLFRRGKIEKFSCPRQYDRYSIRILLFPTVVTDLVGGRK